MSQGDVPELSAALQARCVKTFHEIHYPPGAPTGGHMGFPPHREQRYPAKRRPSGMELGLGTHTR